MFFGLADYVACIACNDELFIGGNNEDLDLGIGGGDHDILAALGVCLVVDGDAQIAEVLGDGLAGALGILADACCEYDGVNTVHCGSIRACDLCDPVMEHIQCQLCALVAIGRGAIEITEVGGNAGNAKNAGFLVEYVEHLVNADAVLVHDKLDNARVQIAAAGAHGEADQGSEAHGGVDALAAVDSGDGAAMSSAQRPET